ncbi:MAG: N-acetylmuramoyl-L-alanine amidase [Armatimonadota bacterium]|nr:N-acetylmuramoyl-L-alanine amidase [bacterium]
MKIALDAGHGARGSSDHTGAAANGLVEDEIALDLVERIGHHLRLAGHKTVLTRSNENMVALSSRGKKAVAESCDLFLSIHCNAGPSTAQGVEAFVAAQDSRGAKFAKTLVGYVVAKGMRSRGVKWDSQSQHSSLRVLRDTYKYMPAVLLEVGFLTNSSDAKHLKDKFFREALAIDIAKACVQAANDQE